MATSAEGAVDDAPHASGTIMLIMSNIVHIDCAQEGFGADSVLSAPRRQVYYCVIRRSTTSARSMAGDGASTRCAATNVTRVEISETSWRMRGANPASAQIAASRSDIPAWTENSLCKWPRRRPSTLGRTRYVTRSFEVPEPTRSPGAERR